MDDLVTLWPSAREASEAEDVPRRVMITGSEGYIGSVLVAKLLDGGFDVVGLDTGYYRAGWLYNDGKDRPRLLARDVRSLCAEDFEGIDAVVHLAELSNDPLGAHDVRNTYEINHRASVAIACNAKLSGVRRFVYTSSCSVYGAAGDDMVNEESTPRPQTAYARCKTLVERDLMRLADVDFSPTFLRNATAFGVSPRMRFDIVLNNLAGLAWTTRRIAMTSDGRPWRPIVHVEDICDAIQATLNAPRGAVAGEIFNVGTDSNNYRVSEIADAVAQVFPESEITFGDTAGDNRSYRVSFEKIRRHLPGFRCAWDVHRGARQLRALFEHVGLTEEMFLAPPYTRLRELRRLVESRQIDSDFRWRCHDFS
ncbi:MAG: NAD-dependent dehydratase [Rhodospirillales bacterium CG15_BIG_FIL_POST_REV_8_21_14_020_66_15]|nr:MAG: NAD-dependent dehydratase [Rhodospirillales bacterium CG15_BIG_FIL_POST_REV_8_21_14_020_66_15]